MRDNVFYKVLTAVIIICIAVTLLLALYTIKLRNSVSILSYIATEGL